MRSISALLAVALLAAGCGEERGATAAKPRAQPPEASTPAGDPATRVDPKTDFVAVVDVAAYREANGLSAEADISQVRKHRAPLSTALGYLRLTKSAVEVGIDHTRVVRAVFDGDAIIVATTQPFADMRRAAFAHGATDDGGLMTADSLFLGDAGPGLVVVGFDAEAVRAAQAREGGKIPAKLERVLDRAGDGPIRAATLDPKGGCVKSVSVSGGAGDQAAAVIEVRGKASAGRSRLGRPAGGQGDYAFQDPTADGSRLTVPFTQYDADLAGFLGEAVYRCS
ncbi:hypothetical protein C8N24_5361 [Solirubrobacter pauli]|uniref:Uncharacterized protein n=1 Tax=Solirubrobacter pauli TaxID=166793 RepID=A0A660L6Z8_9ACTN|nr:hypothetical protein [Solirubrobacter pauli]RKQ87340.1 hypothetical protein C8N24_5361 [Solirubrobacter pauli]